ncbi:MAG: cell division protein FtsA [bacterium]|nr:cell division protein FtsA [bacterium]
MKRGHLIAGLDIGTNTIKALLALKKPGEDGLEVISQAQIQNSGMRKGVVINIDEVAAKIGEAINFCREGQKIPPLFISINGSHLSFIPSRGLVSVSRADQRISGADIERAFQASRAVSLSANQEIIDVFPQEFIIDGQPGVKEAEGLRGIRLEAKTLCLAVFSPYLKNLTAAVLAADSEIEHIIPSVLASCQSVLKPEEKELGVAAIEIGAGTTSLAVYEEGSLLYAAVFPVGSNNITNDIAVVLKTDIETAEKIKRDFFGSGTRKKLVSVDNHGKHVPNFSSKVLDKIVEARTREIFGQIAKDLKKINKTKLPGGVVLTGGGAKLSKVVDFAKKEFRLPCRLGVPQSFTPAIDDLSMAAVCGLVMEGAKVFGKDNRPMPGQGILKWIKGLFKAFMPE